MKNIFFLISLCTAATSFAATNYNRITAQHKPDSVTVYQAGALVTRSADVALKKGRNIIVFSNIPDNINTSTIRMAEQTALPCTIRSITWERATSTLYRNDEIRKLTDAQKRLQQKIQQKKDMVDVQQTQLALLEQYMTLHDSAVSEQGHTAGNNNMSWQSSRETLQKRYRNAQQVKRDTESEIKTLQKELELIRQKLRPHSEGITARRISIIVTADAQADTKATLKVSALTFAAGWTPHYQALVTSGSNTLDLEYSGIVRQHSGESWKDVELILSTAPVNFSATPPTAGSWVLYSTPQQKKKAARKLFVTEERATGAMPVALEARMNITMDHGVKVSEKGDAASVTYILPGKYTIADGNQESSFTITKRSYKTDYRKEAIPELRKNAFLCAEFKNDSPFLFLPGDVAISRDSGYIGTSSMPMTNPGGKARLYAGAVDGISMIYRRTQNFSKTEGIVNKEQCQYETWVTTLINTTDKPIELNLKQRVPVSEVEEVKISIQRRTTPGYQFDAKTGFITWKLTMKPNELKRVTLEHKTAKKNM